MYARMPIIVTVAVAAMGMAQPACSTPTDDSAALVTTLGRDTVVMESYTRSAMRLEGHVVVRFPGTVLIHYVLDLDNKGSPAHSLVDVMPLGTSEVAASRVRIDYKQDSAFVDIDSIGHHRRARIGLPSAAFPAFITGFGASYGLYESPVFFALYQPLAAAQVGDTVHIMTIDIGSGRTSRRAFIKRSPTQLDADFFRIAFAHVTLDDAGRVMKVDARETTERTETTRANYMDIEAAAQRFAAEDNAGRGLGAASPKAVERGAVGGAPVVVSYSSPRRRGRSVLGTVIPYGVTWRTGANEATTLFSDRNLDIGGTMIPAGVYSLWTLPRRDGKVDLIVNSQHGQWGTDYDSTHDVAHIPMSVTSVAVPVDDFAIKLDSTAPQSLRITWDTFVWTVPIALAKN